MTGKLRGAEATQRQYAATDNSRGSHTDCWNQVAEPVLIAESKEITNKPQRSGFLYVETPKQRIKDGETQAKQWRCAVADKNKGGRAGCRDHVTNGKGQGSDA